ncbi:MAG: YbaN family protein [Planctomycetota bacterium]
MNRTKRLILIGIGLLLVGIGAVGVILPGLPTTIFLLGASWCFARSNPWLEERLHKSRFFGPYMRLLDGEIPMTTRQRLGTIAMIWTAVSVSLWILHSQESLSGWGATALIVAALVGNLVVWRFRRNVRARTTLR